MGSFGGKKSETIYRDQLRDDDELERKIAEVIDEIGRRFGKTEISIADAPEDRSFGFYGDYFRVHRWVGDTCFAEISTRFQNEAEGMRAMSTIHQIAADKGLRVESACETWDRRHRFFEVIVEVGFAR